MLHHHEFSPLGAGVKATKPQPIYARRGYSPQDGRRVTFTSFDRADNDPWGWRLGWFEDGHVIDEPSANVANHQLVHVYEPSWRCREPLKLTGERG